MKRNDETETPTREAVKKLSAELLKLTPDEIRARIGELKAEEKALRVILRAAIKAERERSIHKPVK